MNSAQWNPHALSQNEVGKLEEAKTAEEVEGTSMYNKDNMLNPARLEGESFEAYKARRKYVKGAIKAYLRGRQVYTSTVFFNGQVVRIQGPYRKNNNNVDSNTEGTQPSV